MLYLGRVSPAIGLADGGELATAAATLSLTHPPGYPLYAILGKLTMLLPVGNPGFRLAMLSAASAGGAVLLIGAFSSRLGAGRWGLFGAGLLALSPALVQQAALVEKYALNMLFQCGLFLLLLRAAQAKESILPLLGLVGGLSLSHHMQTIYVIPAAGFLFLSLRPRRRFRLLAVLAVTATLGVSLKFVGIPLLSQLSPSLLYGKIQKAGTLARYLSASDYAERFRSPADSSWGRRLRDPILRALASETGTPGLILSGVGAAALFGSAPFALLAGLAGLGVALGFTAAFSISYVAPYLIPCVAFLCALAGLALGALRRRFGIRAVLVLASLALTSQALHSLPQGSLSRFFLPLDWARNCHASLSPGGVLVTRHDDDFYPAMYLQRVLQERTDVVLLHRPFVTRLWYHSQAEDLYPGFDTLTSKLTPWGIRVEPRELIALIIATQIPGRELAFTYLAGPETLSGFSLFPQGCLLRADRMSAHPHLPRDIEFAGQLRKLRLRSAFGPYPAGSRQAEVAGAWRAAWFALAQRWWDRGDENQALRCLERAARYPAGRVSDNQIAAMRNWMAGF